MGERGRATAADSSWCHAWVLWDCFWSYLGAAALCWDYTAIFSKITYSLFLSFWLIFAVIFQKHYRVRWSSHWKIACQLWGSSARVGCTFMPYRFVSHLFKIKSNNQSRTKCVGNPFIRCWNWFALLRSRRIRLCAVIVAFIFARSFVIPERWKKYIN